MDAFEETSDILELRIHLSAHRNYVRIQERRNSSPGRVTSDEERVIASVWIFCNKFA